MPIISETVINEVKKVLREQFNIDMYISDDKYQFMDLNHKCSYIPGNMVVSYPSVGHRQEERKYSTSKDKRIRVIESAYESKLGELSIILEEDGHIWKIYADNHPRTHHLVSSKTEIDCPHVSLSYLGKKGHNKVSIDNREFAEWESKISIISNEMVYSKNGDKSLLAIFYILNRPFLFITFNGIYYSEIPSIIDGTNYGYLMNSSYDAETIKEVLRNNIDFSSQIYNQTMHTEIYEKIIDFLIGRVQELMDYISMHKEEILERFDSLEEESNNKKDRIVKISLQYIDKAKQENERELRSIEEEKKEFLKNYPIKK